jgi:hypothetical protein
MYGWPTILSGVGGAMVFSFLIRAMTRETRSIRGLPARAGNGESLFWQADLFAKSLESRIAAKQSGTFTIHTVQNPAHSNRPNRGVAIQGLEDAVLITQTG